MASFDQLLLHSGLPRAEARMLLEHVSGKSREWLIAHGDKTPDVTVTEQYRGFISRRQNGEPLAYLLGSAVFMGRTFEVTSDVLIPRPETELLVQQTIERSGTNAQVLELGCGSGIICISVALARPDLRVTATDIDPGALLVARRNAKNMGCTTIRFLQGDWFDALPTENNRARNETFSVIASNPPYIAQADHHLTADGLPFEPPHALASGADGLDAITHLVSRASQYLDPGGQLLLEHGYDQRAAVQQLFEHAGAQQSWSRRDENGQWRVSGASWQT